jgi:hypothetical protein
VTERWNPSLHLETCGESCRLVLAGVTHGNGASLQEAADDLVARLLGIVLVVRTRGLRFPAELGPPDARVLDYLWELGELAARGEDLRGRVFGEDPEAEAA